jgi:CBS domain-containing protein
MESAPTVGDFMDKTFVTFSPDMDVHKAIDILLEKRLTGAAVVNEKKRVVGILSEKDCLRTIVHDAYSNLPGGQVKDFMTSPVLHVSPEMDIFTVASVFLKQAFRRLLVIQHGELVGQITRRDLLRVIQKLRKKGSI